MWSKRYFWRRKSIIWKIFSRREESVGLILVECCGSIGFSTNERRKLFRTGLWILWSENKNCCWTAQFYWASFMQHKSRWRFKLQGFERSMQKTTSHHYHAWKKQHQKNSLSRNRRLLRFVTFVHLPFSVRSLDLFVVSLVFMKIHKGHFMSCYKEECYALANFKRS